MIYNQRKALSHRGRSIASRVQGVFFKLLVVVASAVLLASAVAISLILFAIVVAGLLVFGLYLWWKIRKVRKMRAQQWDNSVIEGEVVRDIPAEDARRMDSGHGSARRG